MAEIRAFRGYRYDLGQVGALTKVIAPPYDVIDDALSAKLHAMHGYNVIRLELDPIKPDDNERNNRYTRTARTLKGWLQEKILVEERDPCVYVYSQSFDWEGRRFTRRGFMARIRLEKFGEGKVYPHEETLSGPKADRLKLFHATGMNLSPIFGLYPDPANSVAERLDQAVAGVTPIEAVDHLDVVHRLWPISDPKTVTDLQGLMGPMPIFIADGHHRYETSCKHLEDRKEAGAYTGPEDPANFTMMHFVGMSEPGLQVMPTHRLVTGVGELRSDVLRAMLEEHFELKEVGKGAEAGANVWESVLASDKQEVMAFCTPADGVWLLARLKNPAIMEQLVPEHSVPWRGLGVSILHKVALDHCLGQEGTPSCKYVHLTSEVIDAVRTRSCQVAALVQPATVEHIRQLSTTFERMPAKSTYFYPKLATGMVFNAITPIAKT